MRWSTCTQDQAQNQAQAQKQAQNQAQNQAQTLDKEQSKAPNTQTQDRNKRTKDDHEARPAQHRQATACLNHVRAVARGPLREVHL